MKHFEALFCSLFLSYVGANATVSTATAKKSNTCTYENVLFAENNLSFSLFDRIRMHTYFQPPPGTDTESVKHRGNLDTLTSWRHAWEVIPDTSKPFFCILKR